MLKKLLSLILVLCLGSASLVSAHEDSNLYTPDHEVIETDNPNKLLVLVNKERSLPDAYIPDGLVQPDVPFTFDGYHPKKTLRTDAAKALEVLFAEAKEDRINLFSISGYRSYDRQKAIFIRNAEEKGKEEASRTSAFPGHSEHQTGLAMDVSSSQVNYRLTQEFGNTAAGKWLVDHAHESGFIIRYPKDKEHITGYSYEPWHLRYVGQSVATELVNTGKTLDEYLTPPITITINDKEQVYDQPSLILNGRTMVPLRALFEEFGSHVMWDGETRTVKAINGETTVTLRLDEQTASINDEIINLDVAPQIIGVRTMVPVRFVSEALGAHVKWDGGTKTVIVTKY